MYKFLQVHDGRNIYKFRVTAGKTLNLFMVGAVSFDARLTVSLSGVGARAIITGICTGKGDCKQILHIKVVHEAPSTNCDILVKTVLSGHATCLYDGGIRVEKVAQKTNTIMRNENLLLSDTAYVESKPSLEILANNVRCKHGAATGPVDGEQLWYLMSRGLSRPRAEELLVRGFIQSALDRVVETHTKRSIMSLWEIT